MGRSSKCTGSHCTELVHSQEDMFDDCLSRTCGKFRSIDELVLHLCTQMAQESGTPDMYEHYVQFHNALIDIRHLNAPIFSLISRFSKYHKY
jgi:hypothetical protein